MKAASLTLTVDGKEEPINSGFLRPDVSRHLGSRAGSRSGFIALLRTPEPGQHVSLGVRIGDAHRELVSGISVEQRRALPGEMSCQGQISSYQDWIFQCEPMLFKDEKEITDSLAETSYRPKISLLVEFRECHPYLLSRFFQSLSTQRYTNWQLCIAGDLDPDSESFRYAQKFSEADSRVMILPAARKTDDASVWNAALEAADGEFAVALRFWDELHPSALLEIAASLHHKPADILYADEDEINLFGQRCRPKFKPDFDSERLLASNYIGGFVCIRRSLLLKSGGYHPLPAGAREWDLLLRCVEQTEAEKVTHIAKPLYHLRTQEALADSDLPVSSPRPDDLCQVIRDHVTRTGKQAVARIGFPTDTIRLHYQAPKDARISIFLRDEDGVFQVAALAGLVNQYRVEFYGILHHLVHRLPNPTDSLMRSPLMSFGEVSGDVLLFINRPIDLLNHFFLQELVEQALRKDCGLVAGLSVDLAGHFLHTGFMREEEGQYLDPFAGTDSRRKGLNRYVRIVRSVEAVSDKFFAVRREHVEAIGGFARLSSSRMPEFVRDLTAYAHRLRLQVLVTPYSIAAFDCSEIVRLSNRAIACLNPNLSAFSDPYSLLQS